MFPAGRQMLPVVAFQRRMRPSFPAEANTVLVGAISNQVFRRVNRKYLPRSIPLDPAHGRPVRSRK